MEVWEKILLLAGTCLPLLGTGLTIILASIFKGVIRWSVLFLVPVLTLIASWIWADTIWQDGNMLAAALFFIYLVGLFIYYPILSFTGLIIYRNKSESITTSPDD